HHSQVVALGNGGLPEQGIKALFLNKKRIPIAVPWARRLDPVSQAERLKAGIKVWLPPADIVPHRDGAKTDFFPCMGLAKMPACVKHHIPRGCEGRMLGNEIGQEYLRKVARLFPGLRVASQLDNLRACRVHNLPRIRWQTAVA